MRAAEVFYDSYAEARGFTRGESGQVDGLTQLLRKGDRQKFDQMFSGRLSPDFEGTLAHFTYTVETTDSDGYPDTRDSRFTVVLIEVPEAADYVPDLIVRPRYQEGAIYRALGGETDNREEDSEPRDYEEVTLESQALVDRYRIAVRRDQDANWLRQLFSPTFIFWLTDVEPEDFSFEVSGGHLCAFVEGHVESAEEFDGLISAGCTFGRRLRDEATEGAGTS